MERRLEISDGRHCAPDAGLFQLPQLSSDIGVLVLDHFAPLLAATVTQREDAAWVSGGK